MLNGIEDAAAVQAAITGLEDPNTRFIDHKGQVSARLDVYRRAAVTWFLIGTLVALGCLALLAPGQVAVVNLGLTLAAAISVTAFANAALDGGLGIFQILALTLIAGIGIDYGLFLEMARSAKQRKTAARSVALCAITTLAAFTIMAVSPIQILSEIGRTVTIGVILLVCFGFAMPPEKRGEKPSANEQPSAS